MSLPAAEVTASAGALTKFRASGSAFLLVRLSDVARGAIPPVEHVDLVRDAAAAANTAVDSSTTMATFVTGTVHGVAVALHKRAITYATDPSKAWMARFISALEEGGLSGRVGAAEGWEPNVDHLAVTERSYPTAFVAHRLQQYVPWLEREGWGGTADAAEAVAKHIQEHYLSLPQGDTWAALTASRIPIETESTAAWLRAGSKFGYHPTSAYYIQEDRSAYHIASLAPLGEVVTQSVAPALGWRELVTRRLASLLVSPETADVGMIRTAGTSSRNWADTDQRGGYRTVLLPMDYERNRHLWDQHVIDAAGINLLTDQHLDHAHDLSDWTIEEVAPRRFLVSARDLEPWFKPVSPDEATIRRARADFGDIILGWDAVLAHPGPYTLTDPGIVGRMAESPY